MEIWGQERAKREAKAENPGSVGDLFSYKPTCEYICTWCVWWVMATLSRYSTLQVPWLGGNIKPAMPCLKEARNSEAEPCK